jgi:hypothetical protein
VRCKSFNLYNGITMYVKNNMKCYYNNSTSDDGSLTLQEIVSQKKID